MLTPEIPDYETYDYSDVWKGRGIEDRAEKELVRRLAADSIRRESALDLGGGFGRITRVIEPYFEKVFMLDYSLAGLRRASSTLKKTTLVRSTLDVLPFEDDTFDFITMIRVMQHIPRPEGILREVSRVGRDGGTFLLGIANETFTGYRKVTEHSLAWTTPHGHRVYVTPLSRYGSAVLKRSEVRGVGVFDNRIGRRLDRFSSLSELDVATSRLWPIKGMLFVRFTIEKAEEEGEDSTGGSRGPFVKCSNCGGEIEATQGRCQRCGMSFGDGRIIDLIAGPRKPMVLP